MSSMFAPGKVLVYTRHLVDLVKRSDLIPFVIESPRMRTFLDLADLFSTVEGFFLADDKLSFPDLLMTSFLTLSTDCEIVEATFSFSVRALSEVWS